MILLCCKEMNANKQKNKVLGKNLLDSKGRPKLQLKGRIFMQNVTDTVISAKPGWLLAIIVKSNLLIKSRIVYLSNFLERRPRH
jgi:hypothetical protein